MIEGGVVCNHCGFGLLVVHDRAIGAILDWGALLLGGEGLIPTNQACLGYSVFSVAMTFWPRCLRWFRFARALQRLRKTDPLSAASSTLALDAAFPFPYPRGQGRFVESKCEWGGPPIQEGRPLTL